MGTSELHTALRPVEALALIQAATFDPSRPQHAGWREVPSWGMGVPFNGTIPYFDSTPARPPASRADYMKGTVARRLFELLPPRRLQYLSKSHRGVNRIYKKSELLTEESDSDYVYDEEDGPDYTSVKKNPELPEDIIALITFNGSSAFIERVKEIVRKYISCFSSTLNPEPARVPAMELEVDEKAWRVPKNGGACRPQSTSKEKEIEKQVHAMQDATVIQPSRAPYYSQVHLTPKPHEPDKWRFCIDFRALNIVTRSIGQWIPNIAQLITRIGSAKPKLFGVLDLTSGYYQAPLHQNSWAYTAFRCVAGIFEWMRVPMGLKGAPAYFQAVLVTKVLVGLIYQICELYIDDLIIFGTTEDEFCERLERVLQRAQEFNITFNPKKVKLGMSKVEYVGHMVDSEGISFSAEKISEVLAFPTPVTCKQVRAFLGLCNFFRDHVRNHSMIDHDLRTVVTEYDKRRKFNWTPKAEAAFKMLKTSIEKLAKLYFMHEDGKVVLETDASDYGVGGYLYYTLPNSSDPTAHYPIAFMSKSLDERQQRWDTPEKESYAIFLALRKWDHLLKNIHFRLRTDHKNLTYLNFAGSPKVYRWKLAVQGFDFDIEHVPGKDNIVADVLSRLCPRIGTDYTNFDSVSRVFSGNEQFLESNGKLGQEYCQIIKKFHNSEVGHSGVQRTMDQMEKHGIIAWPHMRSHIDYYIKNVCPCCQKMNQLKPVIHANPFTTSTYRVMELVNVDLIGPFPPDRYGNTFILVIRDTFSRWTDLHAIPNKEAVSVFRILIRFFGTFGWPSELRSDGGAEFVNKLIDLLLEVVGVHHSITLAYSHQENASVERANKEVLRRLRALIFETRLVTIWSDLLPLVQRIMNAHPVATIGVSPAQILFGNAIDLDRHFFPLSITELSVKEGQSVSTEIAFREHLDILLANQSTVIALAQKHLFDNDQATIAKRRNEGDLTEFPIGSVVLVQYHHTGLGKKPPSKLHLSWEGPFRVVNITNSGNTYVLQNFIDGTTSDRHITDLKLFIHDEEGSGMTLSDIALRDRIHEFPVETVLGHRFKTQEDGTRGGKSSDLEFHIHWRGFSARWDSWEPFKNVRLSTLVIDYMRENKMKRFIPRNLEEDVIQQAVVPIINRISSSTKSSQKRNRVTFEENQDVHFGTSLGFSLHKDYTGTPDDASSDTHYIRVNRVHNNIYHCWMDTEILRNLGPF